MKSENERSFVMTEITDNDTVLDLWRDITRTMEGV